MITSMEAAYENARQGAGLNRVVFLKCTSCIISHRLSHVVSPDIFIVQGGSTVLGGSFAQMS